MEAFNTGTVTKRLTWSPPLLSFKGLRLHLSRVASPFPGWCSHFHLVLCITFTAFHHRSMGLDSRQETHSFLCLGTFMNQIEKNRTDLLVMDFVHVSKLGVYLFLRKFKNFCDGTFSTITALWSRRGHGWLSKWMNEGVSTLMVESKLLQSKGLFQMISFASVKESFWCKLKTVLSSFWLPLDSTVLIFLINSSQSSSQVCHFQRSSSGLRLYFSGQLCVKLVVSVVSGRLK